jgi:hypothetical protein
MNYRRYRHSSEDVPDYADLQEAELPYDENLQSKIDWARQTFSVREIVPNSIRHVGGTIALRIEPNATGHCFCKVDQVIVRGEVNESGWAVCRAPSHVPGAAGVFFSRDQKKWWGPIELRYRMPSGFESLLTFAPLGFAIMGLCGLAFWALVRIAENCSATSTTRRVIPRRKRNRV